jgi:hypothetical protein
MLVQHARIGRQKRALARQARLSSRAVDFPFGSDWRVSNDSSLQAGSASGAYFHQDLYVATSILKQEPRRHIDVGSRVDGFVAHVAVFREIEVVDIRPLDSKVLNIRFIQADITHPVPADLKADSVSCLHALEHFGLGRYGDALDFDGWLAGLKNLVQMTEPGGTLYLSVPAGRRQRIEFNAHRVFSVPYLRDVLEEWFTIEDFAFVDDLGDLHTNLDAYSSAADVSFDAVMGCAIWTLVKKEQLDQALEAKTSTSSASIQE